MVEVPYDPGQITKDFMRECFRANIHLNVLENLSPRSNLKRTWKRNLRIACFYRFNRSLSGEQIALMHGFGTRQRTSQIDVMVLERLYKYAPPEITQKYKQEEVFTKKSETWDYAAKLSEQSGKGKLIKFARLRQLGDVSYEDLQGSVSSSKALSDVQHALRRFGIQPVAWESKAARIEKALQEAKNLKERGAALAQVKTNPYFLQYDARHHQLLCHLTAILTELNLSQSSYSVRTLAHYLRMAAEHRVPVEISPKKAKPDKNTPGNHYIVFSTDKNTIIKIVLDNPDLKTQLQRRSKPRNNRQLATAASF